MAKKNGRKSERMKRKERKHLNDYEVLLSITSSPYESFLSVIASYNIFPYYLFSLNTWAEKRSEWEKDEEA